MAVDIAHQLYYLDVDLVLEESDQLETLNNKAMDEIRKEHMTSFHKWMPICDPSLGLKFLHEV